MEQEIKDAVAPGDAEFLDATKLATGLMGDSIATNLFMVGYAFQRGLIPLGEAAIMRAIELNGAGDRIEQAELQLGTPGGGRSGARRRGRDAGGSQARLAAAVAIARRNDRAARQVPHRLPGRGVRQALHRPRGAGARGGRQGDARHHRTHRGRRALLLQAARDQGRVRSRAPVRRVGLHAARRRAVRGRLQADVPPGAAGIQQARRDHRRAEEVGLRPVDAEGVRRAGEDAPLPRHRARLLRPHGGAQDGARADRRIRNGRRGNPRQAHAAEPRDGGRPGVRARAHPRLWPREGSAPQDGEGARGACCSRSSARRCPRPRRWRSRWPSRDDDAICLALCAVLRCFARLPSAAETGTRPPCAACSRRSRTHGTAATSSAS